MKLITIKEELPPEFQPIEFTIRCEDARDLMMLWHRFNIVQDSLSDDYKDGYEDAKYRLSEFGDEEFYDIWTAIDAAAREKRLIND